MRNVFTAETLTDAAIVRNVLVEHGIDSQLVETSSSRHAAGTAEVWIFDDQRETEAEQLIREVFDMSDRRQDWRCRKCKEPNPATFEICWSCRTQKRA